VEKFPAFLIWIPDGELATQKARAALPDSFSRADAVFNISRTALLLAALQSGDWNALRESLHDRVHQPFRAPLIRGYNEVVAAAHMAGALGATLSGAGSSVLIWLPPDDPSTRMNVQNAVAQASDDASVSAQIRSLDVDLDGCVVDDSDAA